jgi:hypothetical protein
MSNPFRRLAPTKGPPDTHHELDRRAGERLDEALAEDFDPSDRAGLLTTSIGFHAILGDPTHDLVDEVERLIGNATDPQRIAFLAEGKAWTAFAEGRRHRRSGRPFLAGPRLCPSLCGLQLGPRGRLAWSVEPREQGGGV